MNYFYCKVRYHKMMENGMEKDVTETYLVDALSFTEAEKRITEEMSALISGDFVISDIKRANYSEFFFTEEMAADKYYACKLEFITLNEKTGMEKKVKSNVLVQASDLSNAMKRLTECMKGTMADYNAVAIKETPIIEVYEYK